MTPVLLYSILLAPQSGIRVDVIGEGKLRFVTGRKVSTSASATLAPNASGLLADETGRLVTPNIKINSGVLRIAMNGTVSVSGVKVGRLVLERPGTAGAEIGFPGDDGMGILQIGNAASGSAPVNAAPAKTAAKVAGPATITMHANSQIAGDRVLLKDVSDIVADAATVAKLGNLDLGALPSLGVRRTLSPWSVKAALRGQGVREDQVIINFPPDCSVARKGQMIDADTIVAEARAKAEANIKGGNLVAGAGPAPMLVPCGDVSYDTDFDRRGSTVTTTVKISVDGKPVGTRIIKFTAEGSGIKYGDAVRITISRNGAVIETEGKAKSAGFVGETIQVTTNDGATLSAVITASGTVEVKL